MDDNYNKFILGGASSRAMKLLKLVDTIHRWAVRKTIICECGEIIDGYIFRDYIKTSKNPSTPTIGCKKCGRIFNFIDDKMSTKYYSSRKELKSLAIRFGEKRNLDSVDLERFLLEVDRLKSGSNLPDGDILVAAFQMVVK